jgi:CheY-like chemotaxis protein
MTSFKLFNRPYTIASVDDDASFVEMLAIASPKDWQMKLFTHAQPMLAFLNAQSALAKTDFTAMTYALSGSQGNTHPIVKVLQYWRDSPQRWAQVEILVTDYAMPKMTGLQLLENLTDWQGLSVLLTGVADEAMAVKAFNEGLIHQYIPKQSNVIVDELIDTVARLDDKLFQPYQLLCETHLSTAQLKLLHVESVQAILQPFAAKHWVEHVVISEPFGILGVSKNGQMSWLQIEHASEIDDLKAIADTEPWDATRLASIHAGSALSNSLLKQALNNQITLNLAPTFTLGSKDLIAAHFEFEAPPAYRANSSYADWFNQNTTRVPNRATA